MKKILAFLLVLVLAAGLLAVPASAEDEKTIDYKVGYSKVDVNPYWSFWVAAGGSIPKDLENYITDQNGNKIGADHILPLPMGGYGGNIHRLSRPELVDDNGSGLHADGEVYLTNNRYTADFAKEMLGEGTDAYKAYEAEGFGQNDGDGIYATCVSIRQNSSADPLLIFSVDFIGMANSLCGQAKSVIIRELKAKGVNITPDRILINATHTHGSVSLDEDFEDEDTYKIKLWGYDDDIDADKQESLLVSFSGKDLNSYLSAYKKYVYTQMAEAAVKAVTESTTNGEVAMHKGTVDVSDATGYQLNGVRHVKARKEILLDGEKTTVEYVTGSSFNVFKGDDEFATVSPSDDSMHVIQFSFPDAEPVLMVNWRAHTTWNNKMGTKAHNNLSADHVAALRYQLEQWGYRPILNYGASGNLGTSTTGATNNIGTSTSKYTTIMPGTRYGYELALAAGLLTKEIQDEENRAALESNRLMMQEKKVAAEKAVSDAEDAISKAEQRINVYNILGRDTSQLEAEKAAAEAKKAIYEVEVTYWQSAYDRANKLLTEEPAYNVTKCTPGIIRLKTTWYDVKAQTSSDSEYQAGLYHNAKAKYEENGKESNDGGLKLEESGYPFLVKAGTHSVDIPNSDGTTTKKEYTLTEPVVLASQYHAKSLINRHGTVNKKRISLCAFTLGDQVAFATVPFEASDRYSTEAALTTAHLYNDWEILENKEAGKWGVPIVMSLTNGSEGYFPNKLAYEYEGVVDGKDVDLQQYFIDGRTKTVDDPSADARFVNGSYEALGAYAAPGEGEEVVKELRTLLNSLEDGQASNLRKGYCQACKETVTWLPLGNDIAEDYGNNLATDHYYLAEDFENYYGQLVVREEEKVCVELNGKTYHTDMNTGVSRGFLVYGTLNLQDSAAGGEIKGEGVSGKEGGTVYVADGGIFNLYSGTVTSAGGTSSTGGAIYVSKNGIFNMYGGTITGGRASQGGNVYVHGEKQEDQTLSRGEFHMYGGAITDGVATNFGGNVQVQAGIFNMYGGTITGGTATNGGNVLSSSSNPGKGIVRFAGGYIDGGTHLMGDLILGGEASGIEKRVTNLKLATKVYTLTLDGTFTGKVNVTFSSSTTDGATHYGKQDEHYAPNVNGGKVGAAAAGASISSEAYIQVGSRYAAVNGTELLLNGAAPNFAKLLQNGQYTYYNNIATAVQQQTSEEYPLVLINNVDSMTLTKDLHLDLNGFDVTSVITNSHKLICKDAATDDYSSPDAGSYGTVPASANPQAQTGYWAETMDGKVSFHRYALKIDKVGLRPGDTGIYYESFIAGDEIVASHVREYGIAMSVYEAATQQDIFLDGDCKTHVWRSGRTWKTGANGVGLTGVMVRQIMKPDLTTARNNERANIPIYGLVYMILEDGTWVTGEPYAMSLQYLSEYMNDEHAQMTDADIENFKVMYDAYTDEMTTWDIPNLKTRMGVN